MDQLDRSDAVNLARNVLDGQAPNISEKGVRNLAEAVMLMDAELTRLYSLRPEAALTWKQVSDVTQRQVAWIDRDARYVAVVSNGREFLLDLPPLP